MHSIPFTQEQHPSEEDSADIFTTGRLTVQKQAHAEIQQYWFSTHTMHGSLFVFWQCFLCNLELK